MSTNLKPSEHPHATRENPVPSKLNQEQVIVIGAEKDQIDKICEEALEADQSTDTEEANSSDEHDYTYDDTDGYRGVPVGEDSEFQLTHDVQKDESKGFMSWLTDKFK